MNCKANGIVVDSDLNKTKIENKRGKFAKAAAGFVLGICLSGISYAEPIVHASSATAVDWTSAGISGVGGGSGTIDLTGVNGSVDRATLYWHGLDNGADGNYDNADITMNGNQVSGTAIGTSSTNCWGNGNSVAYRADVTSLVAGDGSYDLAGLSADTGHNANGASLVVIYDDGDASNDSDLAFFEGNDSSVAGFPGDAAGWAAVLSLNYGGGPVAAEFHVADGQSFSDDSVLWSTPNGNFNILDSVSLWDGNSVPSAGTSRTSNGNLWDIHTFDITTAFGGVAGQVDLTLDGQNSPSDCHGLVLVLLDLEVGTAPPPPDGDIDDFGSAAGPTIPVPALSPVALAVLVMMMLIGVAIHRRRRTN